MSPAPSTASVSSTCGSSGYIQGGTSLPEGGEGKGGGERERERERERESTLN